MRANFTWVLLFALSCCNIFLASGHPVSPVDPSVACSGNSAPRLASLLRRSIVPRDNSSITTSDGNGNNGGHDTLLEANVTAAIAVAIALGILLVLVGLMSAFRMGWSKGLEYQKEGPKLGSTESTDPPTDPSVTWTGEPPIIRGMSERDMNSLYNAAVGSPGRHSFRPGKGVYEIRDGPKRGRTRNGHVSACVVALDKGKAADIGTW
ncbi:hypothetical protein L873DRAFT_228539 [Choiromyces venosus 120613-1]|uniref:Uncharacterized protein n=1 Tax=Choiromyces venosus 120613-1 TaxID=1336337 RepID=A0A3N4KBI1_9PEZI|nr:hypothetical protein L873DRAFT_228539 [Choiromyces venosus 120613-1]